MPESNAEDLNGTTPVTLFAGNTPTPEKTDRLPQEELSQLTIARLKCEVETQKTLRLEDQHQAQLVVMQAAAQAWNTLLEQAKNTHDRAPDDGIDLATGTWLSPAKE